MSSIYERFIGLCADVPLMSKDGANPYFKSKYTTLDEIMKGIKPLIAKHQIAVAHEVSSEMLFDTEGKIVTTTILVEEGNGDKRQKRAVEVPAMQVSVTPIAIDADGETIKGATMTAVCPQNIQQIGSTVTYLKRYSVSAFLGISADEDDDGNAQAFSGATPMKITTEQVQQTKKKAAPKQADGNGITAEQSALIKAFKKELFGSDSKGCMQFISACLGRDQKTLDMSSEDADKVIAEFREYGGCDDPRNLPESFEELFPIRLKQVRRMTAVTAPVIWEKVKALGAPEVTQTFHERCEMERIEDNFE